MYTLVTLNLNSLDLRILIFILVYINSYRARVGSPQNAFFFDTLKLIKSFMNVK